MSTGIGRYLTFVEVLRGEGDPNGQVSVKKADGTFLNVAPLSTLLREWDKLEQDLADCKADRDMMKQTIASMSIRRQRELALAITKGAA